MCLCRNSLPSWIALILTMTTVDIHIKLDVHGYQFPRTSTPISFHAKRGHGDAQSVFQLSSSNNDYDMDMTDDYVVQGQGSSSQSRERRRIIRQSSSTMASAMIAAILLPFSQQHPVLAVEDDDTVNIDGATTNRQPAEPYTRTPSSSDKFKFSYTITPPPSFVPGNKPLKTHLDEINFSPEPTIRGYTLGITVDPVRISNIKEFGSPEEVAARVVTAEVNRDGVFKVTLAKDPKEDTNAGCYDIEYISDGKRGTKRFVTRIYVQDGFLYVLTVQSKEDEYDQVREGDVLECVKSFKPL